MYGTVARVRVKAGMENQFAQVSREIGVGRAPGQIAVIVYQTDNDPRELYMIAMFENREAYHANAASPEQNDRFMRLMAVLETEPEWHDGEVIYATGITDG